MAPLSCHFFCEMLSYSFFYSQRKGSCLPSISLKLICLSACSRFGAAWSGITNAVLTFQDDGIVVKCLSGCRWQLFKSRIVGCQDREWPLTLYQQMGVRYPVRRVKHMTKKLNKRINRTHLLLLLFVTHEDASVSLCHYFVQERECITRLCMPSCHSSYKMWLWIWRKEEEGK